MVSVDVKHHVHLLTTPVPINQLVYSATCYLNPCAAEQSHKDSVLKKKELLLRKE